MNQMKNGFTLIELMVVIAIIGILSTMALPSFQDRVIRTQIQEALNLAQIACQGVQDHYLANGTLPKDNTAAGLPAPEQIIGNYVTRVAVTEGVIDITLGNRINQNAAGKILSIRPAVVPEAPVVPIAWVYGYASVPRGMRVIGDNHSTAPARFLPMNCRY